MKSTIFRISLREVQRSRVTRWVDSPRVVATLASFVLLISFASPAHAQQGDYLLGTTGLLGGAQPSEGVYYQNIWSYYHVSGNQFLEENFTKCGPFGRVCGTLNLSAQASGSLDLFVDQNIFGWTTPLTILGAHYGFLIDLPFAIADANGAADLEPTLSLKRFTIPLSARQSSGGSTKGSIGNMYIEPVNLGWYFKHLDAIISSGFFAPAGPYNSTELLNIGFGHWAGMFGLGAIFYPDAERTWSASVYAHYVLYASQMGRSYTLGDDVPFEWGVGKTFTLPSTTFEHLTLGPVGYAQWQVTTTISTLPPPRESKPPRSASWRTPDRAFTQPALPSSS